MRANMTVMASASMELVPYVEKAMSNRGLQGRDGALSDNSYLNREILISGSLEQFSCFLDDQAHLLAGQRVELTRKTQKAMLHKWLVTQ